MADNVCCDPSATPEVFHCAAYGPVPVTVAPRLAPSSLNCTLVRPGSLTVDNATFTVERTKPASGLLIVTGGILPRTRTVTSAVAVRTVSLAVKRRTYTPPAEKVAVVFSAFGFWNVTFPTPFTFLHVVVKGPGIPSSLATPLSVAADGIVTEVLAVALTTGRPFEDFVNVKSAA